MRWSLNVIPSKGRTNTQHVEIASLFIMPTTPVCQPGFRLTDGSKVPYPAMTANHLGRVKWENGQEHGDVSTPIDFWTGFANDPAPIMRTLDAWHAQTEGEAYFVGGCVRDALCGRIATDFDIAVPGDGLAHARRLAHRFRAAYVPLDEVGRTGRVVLPGGVTLDITSLRGVSIENDLGCRDFTVNAMAVRLSDALKRRFPVIDPFGGANDLSAHRLRAVSEQAFRDDPLRLLRAWRLAATLGLTVDLETKQWMTKWAGLLPQAAPERIHEELATLFACQDITHLLTDMTRTGVMTAILPEATQKFAFFPLVNTLDRFFASPATPLENAIVSVLAPMQKSRVGGNRTWIWLLRFAATVMDTHPSDTFSPTWIADLCTRRLRLGNREKQCLSRLLQTPTHLLEQNASDEETLYRIVCETDTDTPGVAALVCGIAARNGPLASETTRLIFTLLRIYKTRRQLRTAGPLLTGNDLMTEYGIAPGPVIGRLLACLDKQRTLGRISTRQEAMIAVQSWLVRERAALG